MRGGRGRKAGRWQSQEKTGEKSNVEPVNTYTKKANIWSRLVSSRINHQNIHVRLRKDHTLLEEKHEELIQYICHVNTI